MENRRGITLIEVVFSATLISLVLVSVLVIFIHTIDISKRIDYEYTATNLAKGRIERARTIAEIGGFDYLSDLGELDTVLDSDGVPDPDGDFKRSTTVTPNYNGQSKLSRVDVTVIYKYRKSWREDASKTITTVFVNIVEY